MKKKSYKKITLRVIASLSIKYNFNLALFYRCVMIMKEEFDYSYYMRQCFKNFSEYVYLDEETFYRMKEWMESYR